MLLIGIVSAYCFFLVGRVCSVTGATSYHEAWQKAVSKETSIIPAVACTLVPSCSTVAYSMVLSDTIPKLLYAVTGITISRTQALLSLTSFALLPLCLLKDLRSLAPFSLVGVSGLFYTCIAMFVRRLDGTYDVELELLASDAVVSAASGRGRLLTCVTLE